MNNDFTFYKAYCVNHAVFGYYHRNFVSENLNEHKI